MPSFVAPMIQQLSCLSYFTLYSPYCITRFQCPRSWTARSLGGYMVMMLYNLELPCCVGNWTTAFGGKEARIEGWSSLDDDSDLERRQRFISGPSFVSLEEGPVAGEVSGRGKPGGLFFLKRKQRASHFGGANNLITWTIRKVARLICEATFGRQVSQVTGILAADGQRRER